MARNEKEFEINVEMFASLIKRLFKEKRRLGNRTNGGGML